MKQFATLNNISKNLEVEPEKRVLSMATKDPHKMNLKNNLLFRGFLLFAAFRAVYGMGILVVTYFLATSQETPWWSSLIFLACSMVFSRILFRAMKKRWPHVFNPAEKPSLDR